MKYEKAIDWKKHKSFVQLVLFGTCLNYEMQIAVWDMYNSLTEVLYLELNFSQATMKSPKQIS